LDLFFGINQFAIQHHQFDFNFFCPRTYVGSFDFEKPRPEQDSGKPTVRNRRQASGKVAHGRTVNQDETLFKKMV